MNSSPVRARATRVMGALVIGAAAVSITACGAAPSTTAAGPAAGSAQVQAAATDVDTASLVSAADATGKGGHKGGKSVLARALHATWVTGAKKGPVTHQAIRGEVTAVSPTSITVKAKDGFSLTFKAGADTTVRARDLGKAKGDRKATDSTLSAVKVGAQALVSGEGASAPTAKHVLFLTGQKAARTPKPATTPSTAPSPSTPAPTSTS